MAHTLNKVVLTASPIGNVNASGTAEQRGAIVCGEIDISSYTNGGEVLSSSELSLNKIYNGVFMMSGADTLAARSFEVATNLKSATLNIDTAGSGTEISGAVNAGKVCFVVWGEILGSGTN